MNRKRIFLAGFLAISFVSAHWASGHAQTPTKSEDFPLPSGYEGLFEEISKAMKKYPGAAARFSIRDRQATPVLVTPRAGSFHACCVRHHSTCEEWCLE